MKGALRVYSTWVMHSLISTRVICELHRPLGGYRSMLAQEEHRPARGIESCLTDLAQTDLAQNATRATANG